MEYLTVRSFSEDASRRAFGRPFAALDALTRDAVERVVESVLDDLGEGETAEAAEKRADAEEARADAAEERADAAEERAEAAEERADAAEAIVRAIRAALDGAHG